MIKKTFYAVLCAMCCATVMTSCGGGSSSSESSETEKTEEDVIKVSPESTTVGGKWGKAFDFEDKAYTLKVEEGWGSDMEVSLVITFTRNGNTPEVSFNEIAGSYDAGRKYVGDMEAEFLDENDEPLFTANVRTGNYTAIDKLLALSEGDKTSATFSSYEPMETIKKAKKFRITSTVEANSKAVNGSSDSNDDLDKAADDLEKASKAVGDAAKAAGAIMDMANSLN